MEKKHIKIECMYCNSFKELLQQKIKGKHKDVSVVSEYDPGESRGIVTITFDSSISEKAIRKAIKELSDYVM